MPKKSKPLQRLKSALMGAVVIFALIGNAALAANWPLALPERYFDKIPDGQGIKYFYGTWNQVTPPEGGPMVIGENRIDLPNDDYHYEYRIIFEAPDHIIAVAKKLSTDGRRYSLQFVIFTISNVYSTLPARTPIKFYSCSLTGPGTSDAFDWADEKLLDTFKASRCIANLDFNVPFNPGWINNRHMRVEAWPLVLPVETFGNIPDGQGMKFFYGNWEVPGLPQLGSKVITKTRLAHTIINNYKNYRIIHEAPNYILLVTKQPSTMWGYPTQFEMFAIQSLGERVTHQTQIRHYRCGSGKWGIPEAFDWPVEKLLNTFKASLCLANTRLNESVGIGWNSGLYHREGVWD